MAASLADALGIQSSAGNAFWHDAACKDMPLSLFFPDRGSNHSSEPTIQEDRAKRVCAKCPVRRACLEETIRCEMPQRVVARNSEHARRTSGYAARPVERILPAGIFGGTLPKERWSRDVTHLDDCGAAKCKGCRDVQGRIDILEDRLKEQAHRFLLRSEAVR